MPPRSPRNVYLKSQHDPSRWAVADEDLSHGWYRPSDVVTLGDGEDAVVKVVFGNELFERALPNLLEHFLGLADDRSGKQVAAFIRRHGALGTGQDGLPNPSYPEEMQREECRWYRRYATLLGASLNAADRRQSGRPVPSTEIDTIREIVEVLPTGSAWARTGGAWALAQARFQLESVAGGERAFTVSKNRPSLATKTWDPTLEYSYLIACGVANWWMAIGRVQPRLEWPDRGNPRVTYSGDLWGALGFQLLERITRRSLAPLCDICGKPPIHTRRRRAKRGQRAYCGRPECERERVARARTPGNRG